MWPLIVPPHIGTSRCSGVPGQQLFVVRGPVRGDMKELRLTVHTVWKELV